MGGVNHKQRRDMDICWGGDYQLGMHLLEINTNLLDLS